LGRDFRDGKEPQRALEEMGLLQQVKNLAAEYFLCLEQLISTSGGNINDSSHVLLQIERNVNLVLINQLYRSLDAPHTYSNYKQRIITMDKMR
jgi:hypothetical protein